MDENKLDTDIDLFQVLAAIDRKEYDYYDRLNPEQQKKISAFQLTKWLSAITGGGAMQDFYLQSTNYHVNTHLVNGTVAKHPRLLWLMLCAASPGRGPQRHQWIPHLKAGQVALKDAVPLAEAKTYFKKLYPTAGDKDIGEIAKEFVRENKRKVRLAKIYPLLKIADIEILNTQVTDDDLKQYERDLGN